MLKSWLQIVLEEKLRWKQRAARKRMKLWSQKRSGAETIDFLQAKITVVWHPQVICIEFSIFWG
jgi:hypothetical protein